MSSRSPFVIIVKHLRGSFGILSEYSSHQRNAVAGLLEFTWQCPLNEFHSRALLCKSSLHFTGLQWLPIYFIYITTKTKCCFNDRVVARLTRWYQKLIVLTNREVVSLLFLPPSLISE